MYVTMPGRGGIPLPTIHSPRASASGGPDKTALFGESPAASRARDRVRLSYEHVLTAEKEGYIELNGERISVSKEMAANMRRSYDCAAAKNEAIRLQNELKSQRANAERAADALAEENKKLRQAMEISRRISKGGRVPPQDEQFLLEFSPEMYMAAKMAALLAEKHKKHDSALEGEAEPKEYDDAPDDTVHSVEAEISGGEVTGIAAVTTNGSAEI